MMPFDVFLSYRRRHSGKAEALAAACRGTGLRVWIDSGIREFEPVTRAIEEGVAESKALVALICPEYFESDPCQQEICNAWRAALNRGEDPWARIFCVNIGSAHDEGVPEIFRDQQQAGWCDENPERIAEQLKATVESLTRADRASFRTQHAHLYAGMPRIHPPRSIGRYRELWNLHGKLLGSQVRITTRSGGFPAAVLRGLAGSGKTLVLHRYLDFFGQSYERVFYLDLAGMQGSAFSVEDLNGLRTAQIARYKAVYGVEGEDSETVEDAFWHSLDQRERQSLWIVENVPFGLSRDQLQLLFPRSAKVATLVITRSAEHDGWCPSGTERIGTRKCIRAPYLEKEAWRNRQKDDGRGEESS